MDHRQEFVVERMCRVFKVSTSGYYKSLKNKSIKTKKMSKIDAVIKHEYERSKGTYGSPRIMIELKKKEYSFSKSTIARSMKRMKIAARISRRFVSTTDSNHKYKVFDNLLDRNFEVDIPGKVWVSDITYVRVANYWMYLTVVIDLADRMILGWSLSKDMTAKNTVINALNNAIAFRQPMESFMFHSDRGVQYACNDFTALVKSFNGIQSMSRKGNCWDNAVAESFFKTIKVEAIYRYDILSPKQAFSIIFNYINGWYNTLRTHSALNGFAPIDAFIEKSKYTCAA